MEKPLVADYVNNLQVYLHCSIDFKDGHFGVSVMI